jgi:hypothetical protein
MSCNKRHEVAEKIFDPIWDILEAHPNQPEYPEAPVLYYISDITMAQGQVLLETLQCSERILLYNIIMLLQGHLRNI